MKIIKLLLLAFPLSVLFTSCTNDNQTTAQPMHLFLLTGQSNMAGRGEIDEAAKTPNPNILMLTREGQWVPATAPIHYDKPFAGVGLARTFAEDYLKDHPGVTIGLIPAAHGGSPISTWEPGVFFEQTDSHPYDDAMSRARDAMKSGDIKAVLWHQGESDSHPELSALYEEKLSKLIARFRKDLPLENTPIILGQLGQFEDWGEHIIAVDSATKTIAEEDPLIGYVNSDDLTAKEDNIHFNTESLRIFGHRYYEAFKAIQTN